MIVAVVERTGVRACSCGRQAWSQYVELVSFQGCSLRMRLIPRLQSGNETHSKAAAWLSQYGASLIPRLQPGNETSMEQHAKSNTSCTLVNLFYKVRIYKERYSPVPSMLVFSPCWGCVLVGVGQCDTASLLEYSRRGIPSPGEWCRNGSVHPRRGH